jgi:tetratricopeptide (TPR) repeat protein
MTPDGKALFEMAADTLSELPDEPVSADRVMCLLFVTRYRFYCGNAYAGLAPAEQAVCLADRVGDPVLRAKALKMLGVVHLETGNYPDAVTTFTGALAAARTAGESVQEVDILSNLGLAHQYAGHYSAAIPCYERAVEVAEANAIPPLARATALINIGLACLHLRDFPRGLAAVERAIEALEVPSDVHERVIRTQGECYYARLLL